MAYSYFRKLSKNVGTNLTSIGNYTVSNNSTQSAVIGLSVCNILLNQYITVDVAISSSNTETYIVRSAPVPPGSTLIVVGGDQKLVLQSGDSVKVRSDTANSVDAIMSLTELQPTNISSNTSSSSTSVGKSVAMAIVFGG